MQQRDVDGRFDLGSDLVHGVGADEQEVSARRFDGTSGLGQHLARLRPIARVLQHLDLLEIDADHGDARRMQAAQPLLHAFVDPAIVEFGAFPAHAAEQADGFHVDSVIGDRGFGASRLSERTTIDRGLGGFG